MSDHFGTLHIEELVLVYYLLCKRIAVFTVLLLLNASVTFEVRPSFFCLFISGPCVLVLSVVEPRSYSNHSLIKTNMMPLKFAVKVII